MEDLIVNKVAESQIQTLDLADFKPKIVLVEYDLNTVLIEGFLLREKEFRTVVKTTDWSIYKDQAVYIACSEDALIPNWAYMLLATALEGIATHVVIGERTVLETLLWKEALDQMPLETYIDKPVMVKGCGKIKIPAFAYSYVTERLKPVAKSIFYGEACSNVPVFKKGK